MNKATETFKHVTTLPDSYDHDYDFEEWADKTIKRISDLWVKSEDKFYKK